MKKEFYISNRQKLYDTIDDDSLLISFSGKPIRKTGDENYPFYAARNFVYLTGMTNEQMILLAQKTSGKIVETMFILPPDEIAERWTGKRPKARDVEEQAGITNTAYIDTFPAVFHRLIESGRFQNIYLDLFKTDPSDIDTEAYIFARKVGKDYPTVRIKSFVPEIRKLRTIKQPCEIEALKKAIEATKAGIEAMMKASKPGMYEYQYKAEFDYALAQRGILTPGFPSIISAGENNFCIHYYGYQGQAHDGDMILNDVGAIYDGLINDVSRGWPCNGKFNERQRLLYTCAYNTSEYMFSIIKPGMKMTDVDLTARKYNYEQLKAIGLCKSYDEIGKYMWHGGAHHIGFDVHDQVDNFDTMIIQPGMVFCVDIGIYNLDWGIGFRLEDNCLVTEDGCVNLTKDIPRSIEEIEAVMAK